MGNNSSTLYIQADNVHNGGGGLLLSSLIQSKLASYAHLVLDSRMPLNAVSPNQCLKIVSPSIISRLLVQFWLMIELKPVNTLLCFGNLPPLFKPKCKVVLFIQNRYLISDIPLNNFSLRVRFRIYVERLWFNIRCKAVDEFIVQTPSMKIALVERLSRLKLDAANKAVVRVLPFWWQQANSAAEFISSDMGSIKTLDFIYPASGEPHKNHRNLIEAFILLAKDGYYPSLVLTLDEVNYSRLLESIWLAKEKYNLKISNVGFLPHRQMSDFYRKSRYLIYPSLQESFGIPLLEAKQFGLPIVAGELDYVRDSVDPFEVFDPNSPISIARAIKRSLDLPNELATLLDADEFLSKITPPV
jgi:glycosyltransferase involved in cell wall biosynthesis